MEYQCLGWENVGGRRCLKIQFADDHVPERVHTTAFTYWLDMEHGGTPVQREYRRDGDLWARVEDIELRAFPLPNGREYWLPVRGVERSYIGKGRHADGRVITMNEPTAEEAYFLVTSTVALNQGLPDSRFSVDWSPSAPTPGLQAARKEHNDLLRRPRRSTAPRDRIDAVVNEANRQAQVLEASAPSREWWSWTTVGTSMLAAVGVGSIALAGLMRLRGK